MLKKLGSLDFLAALMSHIEVGTGVKCVADPDGEESPFYAVELMGVDSDDFDTKTAFVDRFNVRVHCVSAPTCPYSSAPALAMYDDLNDAMTEDVDLDEPYSVLRTEGGANLAVMRDETDEGHVVVSYGIHVQYGFRCK